MSNLTTPAQARDLSSDQRAALRGHIVNLRMGRFSDSGDFVTRKEDVDQLFGEMLPAEVKKAKAEGRRLELLFYAHGGLVGESSGLAGALRQVQFWKDNNVYPVFFIWETGILETLADVVRAALPFIGRPRGIQDFFSDLNDKLLEQAARPGGRRLWGNMKLSARAASDEDGGALYVAEKCGSFFGANKTDLEIHAAGHSAGAIFQCYFLRTLLDNGVDSIRTLHLLAPAVNTPTFKSKLAGLLSKGIGHATMYTMRRELERDDTAGPYRKSLLYFIHHSFEDPDENPILGLEENLRKDDDLKKIFNLDGNIGSPAEIVFSDTGADGSKRSLSRSHKHGDFDNDSLTMNSIVRRVLNVADDVPISEFPATRSIDLNPLDLVAMEAMRDLQSSVPTQFPVAHTSTALGFGKENFVGAGTGPAPPPPQRLPQPQPGVVPTPVPVGSPPQPGIVPANDGTPAVNAILVPGSRRALCVGIDTYVAPNQLFGCVNDSRQWAMQLSSAGFAVQSLENSQAKRAAITQALRTSVQSLQPGDVFVFHYAGHGTTFVDKTLDEIDKRVEAFCPIDMDTAGFITDDEIKDIFSAIPDGALVTGFIDCCHSGTIFRLAPTDSDPTLRVRRLIPTEAQVQKWRETRFVSRTRGMVTAPRRDVLFAACQDNQLAKERAGHGVFTTVAAPLLAALTDGLTNQQFYELILVDFKEDAQDPNLDCDPQARSAPFLKVAVA